MKKKKKGKKLPSNKERWTYYCFIDKQKDILSEFWFHPSKGYIEMYIDGILIGEKKDAS